MSELTEIGLIKSRRQLSNSGHKCLLITRGEIEKLVTIEDVITAVEAAFRAYALSEAQMPPKSYLTLPGGDFRAMPAYVSGSCGIKWVSSYPNNRKHGLPTIMAVLILNDPETGSPIAIMEGTTITTLRTGAAGAIAAKYLARKNSNTVSLIGCGVQAKTQLLALSKVYRIEEVKLYDISPESAQDLKRSKIIDAIFNVCVDVKSCIRDADIVVTTTPVRRPIIINEWLTDGVHINAMGADAPGKQELDPMILRRAKIVIDDWEQASHSGEINVPLKKGIITKSDIYAELGEIIAGKKRVQRKDEEITIFDSTGLAIQDIATAKLIYERAVETGRGVNVPLS